MGHNQSVSTPRRGAREESVRYVLWLLCCALRPEQRTSEVTGRGASERRHVLDENDLALVVTETFLAAACTPMQPPVSNRISEKGMRSTVASRNTRIWQSHNAAASSAPVFCCPR